MKTAILILLLSIMTVASSIMAHLAKQELARERSRQHLIELLHNKQNGDIWIRVDRKRVIKFTNACGLMPA